jgi:hypothetical protein
MGSGEVRREEDEADGELGLRPKILERELGRSGMTISEALKRVEEMEDQVLW